MRQSRVGAGVALTAALLLVPWGVVFAEELPPEAPAPVEPQPQPPSAADSPPLVSEPIVLPPSTIPEGDFSDLVNGVPSPNPYPSHLNGRTQEENLAYLLGLAQQEVDAALQRWRDDYDARHAGGTGSSEANWSATAAITAASTLAPTGSGERWIPLSFAAPGREWARPVNKSTIGRMHSVEVLERYEMPRTTEITVILVNGSADDRTVSVAWESTSGVVNQRVRVAPEATVHSIVTLPAEQKSDPGLLTVTLPPSSKSLNDVSVVALASPVLPQDLPDSRGYRTAPPR